jgi:hypothetical protein
MVVDDLDVVRVTVSPDEAQAPLVVDSNAVLPRAISFQGFEMVSGKRTEIFERACAMKHFELPLGHTRDGFEPTARFPLEDLFRFFATKALPRRRPPRRSAGADAAWRADLVVPVPAHGPASGDDHGKARRFDRAERDRSRISTWFVIGVQFPTVPSLREGMVKALRASSASLRSFG